MTQPANGQASNKMRWQYNIEGARLSLILALCSSLVVLWLAIAYGFYKENERIKYDVQISPGAVTYGTHSTALMPMTVSPMKHTLPMVSGEVIRSYAHGGHASMSAAVASQGQLRTTSSAKAKMIGSGIENRGLFTAVHSTARRAERGIVYNSAAVMPATSMLSSSSVMRSTADTRLMAGLRKAKPGTDGTEGEWRNGGGGDDDWWRFDEGEWVEPQPGDTRPAGGGNFWRYDGGGVWTLVNNMGDPVVPVGPTPWLLMLLLVAGYGVWRRRKQDL